MGCLEGISDLTHEPGFGFSKDTSDPPQLAVKQLSWPLRLPASGLNHCSCYVRPWPAAGGARQRVLPRLGKVTAAEL